MIGRLLDRITDLLLRRPRAVLGVAFAVVLLAGVAATRLRLDPDVLNLIPRGNREVNEFRQLLKDTGTLDLHVIVVEFPKGSDPATYTPLLDSIDEAVRKVETDRQRDLAPAGHPGRRERHTEHRSGTVTWIEVPPEQPT